MFLQNYDFIFLRDMDGRMSAIYRAAMRAAPAYLLLSFNWMALGGYLLIGFFDDNAEFCDGY